jgi:anthranilate phosphoribosyltransferase
VIAACGVPVAKHGNRSFSSKTGSADVLEALGVNVNLTPAHVAQCVDQIGIGFCFAPLLHGAMKHATPVRRQLGFRTIFNLLGPLTNPAGAHFQVVGTIRPDIAAVLAGALAQLGTTRAFVVCGAQQLDEVALWGTTDWWQVEQGTVTSGAWTLADLGLTGCVPAELQIDSPTASAAMIREALGREDSAAQRIILANAAAGLLAAGRCSSIGAGVNLARGAVHSGSASLLLGQLATLSHQLAAANP